MALPKPDPSSVALVTGASSGIGVEIARELARRGHGVALAARREERLRELAAELVEAHGVRAEPYPCDLTDGAERRRLLERVAGDGLEIEVLVNNAGFGGHSDFIDAEPERHETMVRLNVEAVTDLLARCVPRMVERGRGAVINVASTAAFQPMPGDATYGATKAFVLSQGEALSHELRGSGVTVCTVCPGPVKTEFIEVAGVDELAASAPEFVWTSPEEIASAAVEGAERGKRVVVPGALNQAGALAGRLTPRKVLLPAVAKIWNR